MTRATHHMHIDMGDLIFWIVAFTLFMVLLAFLKPVQPIKPLDAQEREQLVQECVDIFTMEGEANIAACLELRHTPPEGE